MAPGAIKDFYRQRKKGGAASSSSKKKSGKPRGCGATAGADAVQTPSVVPHGDDDYGPEEEKLRQFDMDMRYGPCIGLTRLQRWDRASAMDLHPPPDIGEVLRRLWQYELRRRSSEAELHRRPWDPKTKPNPALVCFWDGRG